MPLDIPETAIDILRRFDSAANPNGAAKPNGGHASSRPSQPHPGASTGISADLAQMVMEVERFVRRFVVLAEAAYLPIVIWTVGTHAAQQFDCFPYLALLSPAKRCGKTRLLEVLETLVSNPWRGIAPSPAALYRMMASAPTLLLDEVEALNSKNKSECAQAILGIVNAGHRKGATIPRCDGPRHELKHFPVYGPKAFAAIGRLPDTLTDRSIVIPMQRRTKSQKVERFLAGVQLRAAIAVLQSVGTLEPEEIGETDPAAIREKRRFNLAGLLD